MYSLTEEDSNIEFKQDIIDYLGKTINISNFKYELINDENDFNKLLNKKYYVAGNFSGINCLLIFAKIKGKFYQFLIDRKTLSYNLSRVSLQNLKIFNINIKISPDIYNESGTIFDGIFVQTKNEKKFVISDVFVFKGKDMTDVVMETKLLSIITYLRSNYNQNSKDNNLIISVNKIYNLEDIEKLVKCDIHKIKDFKVKGICFYPEKSGTKQIILNLKNNTIEKMDSKQHNNVKIAIQSSSNSNNIEVESLTNQNNRNKQNNVPQNNVPQNNVPQNNVPQNNVPQNNVPQNNVSQNNDFVNRRVLYPKENSKIENYIFELKKTDCCDVYYLYCIEPAVKDNKNCYKRVKIDIAYIPGMARSKWCEEQFGENNINSILVHCNYVDNKWEPISIETKKKKPSLISDFDIRYE